MTDASVDPVAAVTPDEVADRVSAAPVPDSQVLLLTAQADSAARTVDLLETYRDQYLSAYRDRERARRSRTSTKV